MSATYSVLLPGLLHRRLLESIPRILCLLDKNPLSPSYGCLDRKYWQYKIQDFPSGMQQELARPLAWACSLQEAPWGGSERMRAYARAAIRATARMARKDGALDDYFPWERALGATAYALCGVLDACRILAWTPDAETLSGLRRMGGFLIRHRESGMLANHHAIAANALFDLAGLCGDTALATAGREKIRLLESLQHEDGWFPEYEGCDPGYQTVSLEFLARCHCGHPGSVPEAMLRKLLGFLRDFTHPDGSLGGEYGSRNTYNFYPGGFALLSAHSEDAAVVLERYAFGLTRQSDGHLDDDGAFGHLLSSYVTALGSPCQGKRADEPPTEPFVRYYPGAELWRAGSGSLRLFGNLNKGGAFKLFQGDSLLCSDTGYAGELDDGRTFSQNIPGASQGTILHDAEGIHIEIRGTARKPARQRMTPFKMLTLRGLGLVFGRFQWFSQLIRRLMQLMLIYKKTATPVRFSRRLRIDSTGLTVSDEINCLQAARIRRLYRAPDDVTIHVVTSDAFQAANLRTWVKCDPENGRDFSETRHFAACPQGENE